MGAINVPASSRGVEVALKAPTTVGKHLFCMTASLFAMDDLDF